jgi:hypothetical protein
MMVGVPQRNVGSCDDVLEERHEERDAVDQLSVDPTSTGCAPLIGRPGGIAVFHGAVFHR